jgi:hypothetical protein
VACAGLKSNNLAAAGRSRYKQLSVEGEGEISAEKGPRRMEYVPLQTKRALVLINAVQVAYVEPNRELGTGFEGVVPFVNGDTLTVKDSPESQKLRTLFGTT